MLSKGTTWPPRTPARTHAVSGSTIPATPDPQENSRSTSESLAITHGDSRPVDSQWESIIDRATD